MSISDDLPGGPMASRPVHFFWLIDASSSMSVDGRMAQVDNAMREVLPEMRDIATGNPTAELFVRVITFSNGAKWLVPQPTPVDEFSWSSVQPEGLTDFGQALRLVATQLDVPPMPQRALPPVLAVISDGMPTDDWRAGLNELNRTVWAKKAIRLAILIGSGQDPSVLQEFTEDPELVFQVDTAPQLARMIRWASTVVVKRASEAVQNTADSRVPDQTNIQIPDDDDDDDGDGDIWL